MTERIYPIQLWDEYGKRFSQGEDFSGLMLQANFSADRLRGATVIEVDPETGHPTLVRSLGDYLRTKQDLPLRVRDKARSLDKIADALTLELRGPIEAAPAKPK